LIAIGNWISNRFIWARSQGIMDKTFANWRRCVTLLARTSKLMACAICCLLAGVMAAFPQGAPPQQAAAGSAASAADTDTVR
jgi:hypothetical protein